MDELVPVIMGIVAGAAIWLIDRGPSRLLQYCAAIVVIAAIATVTSGEYEQSWLYLVPDLAEAAASVAGGAFLAARLFAPRRSSDARATR
jgi:hypothetical protein